MQLAWRLNHRKIVYSDSSKERIGVLCRHGHYKDKTFLGPISKATAIKLNARPVKLQVSEYTLDDFLGPWHKLNEGEHLQGALIPGGVFVVVDQEGLPRVV